VGFDDVDAFATETSVGWTPKSIWPALRQAHGARASWATARDTADRLWAVSERWTGAPFTL
jgi:hypothetical protein